MLICEFFFGNHIFFFHFSVQDLPRKESLEAMSGEAVPPKDFSHGAEAASLLVRLVRALPQGFLLRTMLEPLVQDETKKPDETNLSEVDSNG